MKLPSTRGVATIGEPRSSDHTVAPVASSKAVRYPVSFPRYTSVLLKVAFHATTGELRVDAPMPAIQRTPSVPAFDVEMAGSADKPVLPGS